jgi:hypothetical protein
VISIRAIKIVGAALKIEEIDPVIGVSKGEFSRSVSVSILTECLEWSVAGLILP